MSRSVRQPDYRRRDPVEAAAVALFLVEHPYVTADTWALLDQTTRDWWTRKAEPIINAIRRTK